ncbi:hypothetical protein [Terriglobus tenax]|uniref:hypothetical protein n=1 Tax=Terriglobus tenax TaxID=1111115 RepID=UPI0021E0EA8B|nr:hypothetical protein [Terriglobus tenax]
MAETMHTEPLGFTERTRGLAGEHAHEQGWQLFEQERMKGDNGSGREYDSGPAQNFGDTVTKAPPLTDERAEAA